MSLTINSTVSLLESELARARTTLEEIPSHVFLAPTTLREDITTGSMADYRENPSRHVSDLIYGQKRLTSHDLELAPSTKTPSIDLESATVEHREDATLPIQPPSLLDMLSNALVLGHLAPYLSLASLFSLASTSRAMRCVILHTPYVFRHMDLTNCRTAVVPEIAPIDNGGQTWRSERMDEAVTEDDFYAGPIRGIFSKLQQRSILPRVRTLVLDGLSVPAELVSEILSNDRFNVNVLSIRDCIHLNERKLMQALQYAVRSGRPKETPRVKGIYHFTSTKSNQNRQPTSRRKWWRTRESSAGNSPTSSGSSSRQHSPSSSNSHTTLTPVITGGCHSNEWYKPSGKVLRQSIEDGWARTIQKCEGIISFDAVLCRGPRHDVNLYSSSNTSGEPRPIAGLLGPAIATVALGPRGCDGCHTSPEGPAIWGRSPGAQFPLLLPLPLHSSTITDAKRPLGPETAQATLIARCADCLISRWCHRCHKWFCYKCMPHPKEVQGQTLSPHQTAVRSRAVVQRQPLHHPNDSKKLQMGVSRDCWECGPTCSACKLDYQRICQSCQGGYCIEHNEGCSLTKCDWCNTSSRRLGTDLY